MNDSRTGGFSCTACRRGILPASPSDGERHTARGRRLVEPEAPILSHSEPRWSPQEERIFDRYLDALRRGEYFFVRDAAAVCYQDLRRLSQERPDVCPAGCRKLSAVHNRLNVKAKAAGRSAYLSSWSRPEVRVVERFARALAGRRYSATRQATEDCHRELDRLRRLRPRDFAPRTYHAVRVKLVSQARGLGWTGCGRQMLKPERRIFEDCVRGLVSGRTRTVAEATRVYFGRLQHLQHRLPALRVKTARTIKSYLLARVHEQGRWRDVPWTKQETSIAERY